MYSVPAVNIVRERNLAGGLSTGGGIVITSPSEIAGTSVTVIWTAEGITADTFNITIGTTQGNADIADSGDITTFSGSYTFTSLAIKGTIAYIGVGYKYRSGDYTRVYRQVPITYKPPVVGPSTTNWDDAKSWDDATNWAD